MLSCGTTSASCEPVRRDAPGPQASVSDRLGRYLAAGAVMVRRWNHRAGQEGSPLGETGWIVVLVVMTVLDIIWFWIWWPYWFFVLAGIVWELFAVAICVAGVREVRDE
jgi:hypothetical protein